MKIFLAVIVVASPFVVGVVAQGQQPATETQQPATQGQQPATQGQPATRGQQPATSTAAKVTISGCIEAAPAPAPTAGGAPSTRAASKFDLANAKVTPSGAVGTTGAAPTATRYRLEGEEKTISPHLNHQVEITGTVSPASAAGPNPPTAAPMLKVESLKMIAAKCS